MKQWWIAGLAFLALAGASARGDAARSEADGPGAWREVFPFGASIADVQGLEFEVFEVRDALGKPMGWVFRTDRVPPVVHGHNKRVQIGALVGLRPDGKIKDVRIESHGETPTYFRRLTASFFKRLTGRDAAAAFDDIAAVTGATQSSSAVIQDVMLSAQSVLNVVKPAAAP